MNRKKVPERGGRRVGSTASSSSLDTGVRPPVSYGKEG